MPKQEVKENRARASQQRKASALQRELEYDAILDDEVWSSLDEGSSNGISSEDSTIRLRPLLEGDKIKIPVEPKVRTPAVRAPIPPVDDIPDSWEDLISDELEEMEGNGVVSLIDVGAGTRGVFSAMKRPCATHCLSPVVIPQDVGRSFPAQAASNPKVTMCRHKLADCTCLSMEKGSWLGIAEESVYYLTPEDWGRFEPGDRLIVKAQTYHSSGGSRGESTFEVRDVEIDAKGGAISPWLSRPKVRAKVVKSWQKKSPWKAYYHTDCSRLVEGVVIREGANSLYAYPVVKSWTHGVYIAVYHFTSQRLSCGEFVAREALSYADAKEAFEGCTPVGGSVAQAPKGPQGQAAGVVTPPPSPPTPVVPGPVMPGQPPTTATVPLNVVAAAVVPTPAALAIPKVAIDHTPEIRSYARTRLLTVETKGGTKVLLPILTAMQRRFQELKLPAEELSKILEEELALVRKAQLYVAKSATDEQSTVKVLNGEKPSLASRMLETVLGNDGQVVEEVKRRVYKDSAKKRKQFVKTADSVGGGVNQA